jgi:bacillithiol system protein YtxJ
MGIFSSNKSDFPWIQLSSSEQLNKILNGKSTFLIFKHSTRCSISSFALRNFEKEFNLELKMNCYFLDLIQYRTLSNEIAEKLNVFHQSPQILFVRNGELVYNASHEQIDAQRINTLMH